MTTYTMTMALAFGGGAASFGFAVELKSRCGAMGGHQKEMHAALGAAGVRVLMVKETQAGRHPFVEMTPAERMEHFQQIGREGGLIGGRRTALNMTPEQRVERARKAVAARWAKTAKERARAKAKKKS